MEFVFVVPRGDLFPDCYPQGFTAFGASLSEAVFEDSVRRHGFFVQREHAERNPGLKQVIPYTVVIRGTDVLLLRRLRTGGESRLHHKLSIGVGGHINPQDAGPFESAGGFATDLLEAGARREIEEELHVSGASTLRRVGILNDDSNPVGAVHVGLVQTLHVEGDVRVREEDMLEGRFARPDELRRLLREGANFETWSARLIERLDELHVEQVRDAHRTAPGARAAAPATA
jgi:predicted NUDIX family phosphoesterase